MMAGPTRIAVCASIAIVMACGTSAQTPPTVAPIDVQKLGPQVGTKVPDFSLPDQSGQRRTLQSMMGPTGALLVFFRSADW